MNFKAGYIYHIYNQGNNRQNIFFKAENYLFFLKKIKTHILPYTDIFAWCLMPNHFHLMVLVNDIARGSLKAKPLLHSKPSMEAKPLLHSTKAEPSISKKSKTLNHSIGIMLRSYTMAINKQQNRSGSLFRKQTKAICLNCPTGISPAWFTDNGIIRINISNLEKQYPQICFHYIHNNPVKSGLVKRIEDWEYSSARDYMGLRSGKLINKKKAQEYIET